MKQVVAILLLLAIWFFASQSCRKPGRGPTGGGKGGTAKLAVTSEFSDTLIDSCIVFIKYGTLDAPANGVYDDSAHVEMINGRPIATFDSLKVGIYYIYGVGYHLSPSHPTPFIAGGDPVTISKEDSIQFFLPVDPNPNVHGL